jgi:hypothetical protein
LEKHLALCLDFYNSGPAGTWWKEQVSDLYRGLEWCRLHIRDNSKGELQNRQQLSSLSQRDVKLLTHFINSF